MIGRGKERLSEWAIYQLLDQVSKKDFRHVAS